MSVDKRSLRGEKSMDEEDPVEIESFRIGERLGKGAFATVYKALNSETGDFVALKRIRVDKIKHKQLMKLLAEGHLMEQLQHEHIVQFEGAIETENHILLILEYVDSGSLASVIQKYGNLNEKLAANYMKQVLQGLNYLHENGVVHRDIKSHNLLITNSGVVKLADFGIAHLYGQDSDSLADTDIGSPYWMAPEVIQLIEASPASDIWSIGCTLIELITGKPPYYELSKTAACFRMVEDSHPPLPEGISPELKDFFHRCFKKEPKQRATAEELLDDVWFRRCESKKGTMKKHVSITHLPRFQVNAQESKKAAQKAAMVKKSISVTTLPRYAVNPTLEGGEVEQFKSLRGNPKKLEEKETGRNSAKGSLRLKYYGRGSERKDDGEGVKQKKSSKPSGEKDDAADQLGSSTGKSLKFSGDTAKSNDELPDLGEGSLSRARGAKAVAAKTCSSCDAKFGFMGRILCDMCKNSFCKNCVSKKINVPKVGKNVRLCNNCMLVAAKEEQQEKKEKKSAEKTDLK